MKAARFVLKFVALGLVVGAAVCAVIAYWDKLVDAFYNLSDTVEEKRAKRSASEYDEYEDYVDFEEWENC